MLADAVLLAHFALATFVALGLPLVWLGAWRHWRWVRARGFRHTHLAAIGVIAAESLAGIACPLTVWEDALRGAGPARSFVGRWVAQLLYYDLPEPVFTIGYTAFAAATAATLWLVPPRPARTRAAPDESA